MKRKNEFSITSIGVLTAAIMAMLAMSIIH